MVSGALSNSYASVEYVTEVIYFPLMHLCERGHVLGMGPPLKKENIDT